MTAAPMNNPPERKAARKVDSGAGPGSATGPVVRRLAIDDVCACVWERSNKQFRGGVCAINSIPVQIGFKRP